MHTTLLNEFVAVCCQIAPECAPVKLKTMDEHEQHQTKEQSDIP